MIELPDDVLAALPARFEAEQAWQNALLIALPRVLPVRLFRQQAGSHKVEGGGFVRGAPRGASDLTGWARGGLRLEIECKLDAGRTTREQHQWAAVATEWGCLVLPARGRSTRDTAPQIVTYAEALRAALMARGVACE